MKSFWVLYVITNLVLNFRNSRGNDWNSTTATKCTEFPWSDIRLPLSIEPSHYILRIRPNVTTETFTGSVDIELNIKNTTDFIVLHSKELNISEVNLTTSKGNVGIKLINYCTEREQVVITLNEKLLSNSYYTLSIKFSGHFSNQIEGLYKTGYVNAAGKQR